MDKAVEDLRGVVDKVKQGEASTYAWERK